MSAEKKGDMFVSMYERRDIVDFIREVERHPCLYDNTSPDNLNRLLTQHAWAEIAKISNSTVASCKDKWKKIRTAYMRATKLSRRSNPPSRPYYLAEHLQFLLPFLKIGDQETNPSSPEPLSDDDHLEIEISENSEGKMDYDRLSDRFTNGHGVFVEESTNYHQKRVKKDVHFYKRVPIKRGCGEIIESNPRKLFLMSILPEIESLTEGEMRMFRKDVISSIDKIFNEREGQSSI